MKKFDLIFDEWLVIRYYYGDRKALPLLVKRWHKKLLSRIYMMTQDFEASKDIAQESWQAIIKGIDRLKDPAHFGKWAMTIANRKSIDWIRKQQLDRKRSELRNEAQKELNAETQISNQDQLKRDLKQSMQDLSDDQRIILNLFYLDNYSINDIADILNIAKGTVKSRLYHAREHLKKILAERINHEK